MTNHRKFLYPLAALLLSILLAACAGTRDIESFAIVHDNGEPAQIQIATVGETVELAGRVTFTNQTVASVIPELIDWSSSDSSVASVTAGGVVTAESMGSAVITGVHKGFEDEVTILVSPF